MNILEALRHRRDKFTFGGFPSLHSDDLKVIGAGTNTTCAACKGKPYCQHEVSLMEINTDAVRRRDDALLMESIHASQDREIDPDARAKIEAKLRRCQEDGDRA